MSTTPMNDTIAEKTIEDHKYLLELIENRVAIAYFACANRNQSLFNALKKFVQLELQEQKENKYEDDDGELKQSHRPKDDPNDKNQF